ncbi:hypothetical protein [Aureibaculum marinum]|nr:hypothetical protein [Aureibaculum marinum]
MKNITLLFCFLLCIACKKEQSKQIVTTKVKRTVKTTEGTISLSLDGKTYIYDNIDWRKSKIINKENVKLSIRQEGFPIVQFMFPDIKKSLADGQEIFEIPDVHRPGFLPITLIFTMTKKDKEVITFRKGQVKVSFNDNHLIVEFTGEGRPMSDSKTIYPIEGTINVNLKK